MRHTVRARGPWEYFVRKVAIGHPKSCWEWMASCGTPGYGNWGYGKQQNAHRAAYILFFGDPGELQVNHSCGNRKCCNPDHLYAGDQRQNVEDARTHGTLSPPPMRRGTATNTNILTEDQVREIRRRRASGESGATLSREFGVGADTICAIHKRKNWAWLPD